MSSSGFGPHRRCHVQSPFCFHWVHLHSCSFLRSFWHMMQRLFLALAFLLSHSLTLILNKTRYSCPSVGLLPNLVPSSGMWKCSFVYSSMFDCPPAENEWKTAMSTHIKWHIRQNNGELWKHDSDNLKLLQTYDQNPAECLNSNAEKIKYFTHLVNTSCSIPLFLCSLVHSHPAAIAVPFSSFLRLLQRIQVTTS